jgi:hypothetical protein
MMRVALAVWLLAVGPLTLDAQSRLPAPEEVEAAYLYQFGRYVEWPADRRNDGDTFLICVLGTDPFRAALEEIVADKVIDGRRVVARRIAALSESPDCRVLFISPSEDRRVPEILKALGGTRILTVGRGAQFTKRGGMIAFTLEARKVRFVVNLAATEAAQLTLSSQLLRVAARVEE